MSKIHALVRGNETLATGPKNQLKLLQLRMENSQYLKVEVREEKKDSKGKRHGN